MADRASIYLHIPFCRSKCAYCDFASFAGMEPLMEPYIASLLREIDAAPRLAVPTVYIGGGTPSYLSAPHMEALLKRIAGHFYIDDGAEFTIEANPGTALAENFRLWRLHGVNRLSIGVQSFSDRLLKGIGRGHNAVDARNTVAAARTSGFDNVSIDLIYGLPGQTVAGLKGDLRALLGLRPEHASVYQLILEEGTPLEKMVAKGEVSLPSDDDVFEMGEAATGALTEAGYFHYEVSNYALPGRECRHNTAYWLGKQFLGLGSGAHSFIDGRRLANPDDVQEYIHLMETKGSASIEIESDRNAHVADYLIMRLRLINNDVSYKELSDVLSLNFKDHFWIPLMRLQAAGYVTVTASSFRLTNKGIRYLDNIILELSNV